MLAQSLYNEFVRRAFLVTLVLAIASLAWAARPGGQLGPQTPDARPLPDSDSFLREVRQRLASDEELQGQYAYKERSTELRLNPFGALGMGAVQVYEVYPSIDPELTYRRLIERNGVPVKSADLARRDREYRDKVRRALKDPDTARRQAEQRRKQRRMVNDVLGSLRTTVVGRDTVDGEPAIVVEFGRRPHADPQTREGRIVAHFQGRAWVHEIEYQVMKIEAAAVGDVTFGFGLIGRINRGSAGIFVRRKVNGEAWLPVEARFKGTGRALLFRKIEINWMREYYDYRRRDPNESWPFLSSQATTADRTSPKSPHKRQRPGRKSRQALS